MNPQPKPKTTRLKGKAYAELRKRVCKRARSHCEICGAWAPLYDYNGCFDVFYCGHLCHFKSRGAGGEDLEENTYWGCYSCHINGEHGPKWGKR